VLQGTTVSGRDRRAGRRFDPRACADRDQSHGHPGRRNLSLWPQIILSGITAGSVYALVALGFVLIYKGTHVIHFGLGEQVALGAYLVIIIQLYASLPFSPAILCALIAAGAIGFLLERVVMRPIKLQPVLVQIIARLAIGLGIREGLRAFMGPQAWPFEFLLSPAPVSVAGIYFAWANLAIVIASLAVMAALYVFFH